jgi:hypothetical protein
MGKNFLIQDLTFPDHFFFFQPKPPPPRPRPYQDFLECHLFPHLFLPLE